MRLVRVAIANVNTTVGAMQGNVDRALVWAKAAAKDGATVVAFPEQLIGGYAPEDLVQWRAFVAAQWVELRRFAKETKALTSVFVVGVTVAREAELYNCAAVIHRGRVLAFVPKEKLPTYGVFYEGRTFSRGRPGLRGEIAGVPFGDYIFDFDFGSLAVEVCEDIWTPDGPLRRRCFAGAELVVNISASPFRLGVVATRREMLCTRAADNHAAIVYANLVGANDGLVFDGGGLVTQNGRLLLEAPRFVEGVHAVTLDLDRTRRLRTEDTTWRLDQEREMSSATGASSVARLVAAEPTTDRESLQYPVPANKSFFLPETRAPQNARVAFCEDLLDALTLGVGDYFEKTGAFQTIGVALSGGRDSLLCLWIARRYVDKKFASLDAAGRSQKASELLRAFFMPSRYSSAETRAAAEAAAGELHVPFSIVSIDDAYAREIVAIDGMLQTSGTLTGLARQNIQARIRAARMWTWANSSGGLFLQTSNMSEKSVGYTTIGGDMEGALSVIANVPKTVVNYLLDYLYEQTRSEAIRLTLKKPASAELAENMEDERDLMPFPVLDACFYLYAGEKMSPDEVKLVLQEMFTEHDAMKLATWADKFAKLFTQSIYKWVQTPLSLHVGNLDLDRERALQLPVVQKTEWQSPK